MDALDFNREERVALVALLSVYCRKPEPFADQETCDTLIKKFDQRQSLNRSDITLLGISIDTVSYNLKKKLGLKGPGI